MDIWDFIFSLIPDKAETKFNKAFNHYSSNVASIIIFSDIRIKPLASSPKFYDWVLRKFGADAPITAQCFNDLLETRVSLDIQLQASNFEVPIRMNQRTFKAICDTFKIYCNVKNFFLPSHLETISRSASHEILGPLFEHYLADLIGIEVTYQLPMESIEDLDIMQTEESNDMEIIENVLNGDQTISQNDQISSAKRKLETKEIKEIKELWKEKLEDMHYNSIYNGSGITNPFRNCLRIFVEEKLPYAEEKSKRINNCLSKRRKYSTKKSESDEDSKQ
ncbi:26521_t:CDS:1 [Dentiscutata erythropus]|uniref:26521_t:CDS:1 n=1 Tax=Dentiscutata erythropus TaxID=1348616 RepID=A0A9N9NIY0_9GLOM|nr:26521_t:CDS:1 [Dentiscutata erythropus]